jgi:hypothetical protein
MTGVQNERGRRAEEDEESTLRDDAKFLLDRIKQSKPSKEEIEKDQKKFFFFFFFPLCCFFFFGGESGDYLTDARGDSKRDAGAVTPTARPKKGKT